MRTHDNDMNRGPLFVDTWGWLALGHRKDTFHEKVEKVFQRIQADKIPVYTSEYILDELITLLFRRETYAEAVNFIDNLFVADKNSELKIEKISKQRFVKSWQLRKSLHDKPKVSFTDITSTFFR